MIATIAFLAAACTAAPSARPSSTAPSVRAPAPTTVSATTPSAAACPAPAAITSPLIDFPHPDLARRVPTGTESAADAALADQGLAATGLAGPIARQAFQHYLDADGSYLALPVDTLLTARPALVAALDRELGAAVNGAIASLQQTTNSSCQSQPFATGWVTYGDDVRDDWYYALGHFAYQVVGTVAAATPDCVVPGCIPPVIVTFQAAIGDTYNFDAGTSFARFEQLALDGYAADFLDGGLTTARSARIDTAGDVATVSFGNR